MPGTGFIAIYSTHYAFAALAADGSIVAWCVAYLLDKRKQQLQYVRQAFNPHNKLKILIGFYMIATKVDTVYEVSLPPQVKRVSQ